MVRLYFIIILGSYFNTVQQEIIEWERERVKIREMYLFAKTHEVSNLH